jgi:hypothetical protein
MDRFECRKLSNSFAQFPSGIFVADASSCFGLANWTHTHTVWSSGTQGKQKAARMTVVQLPLPNNNNNPKNK